MNDHPGREEAERETWCNYDRATENGAQAFEREIREFSWRRQKLFTACCIHDRVYDAMGFCDRGVSSPIRR